MSRNDARSARQPTGGPGVTRFATRGDHRLSYESSGADDGISVLALHDLLADRGQLRGLAAALTGDDVRLTLPDARGHGASPMIAGGAYPSSELAADALAVLDAEGITETHVAAIGWGAVAALELAVAAPERILSLVLAAPYLPGLLAEPSLVQEHDRHLALLNEAATTAETGQTDRALDLFLGLRIGEGWREQLAKPRLAAVRRSVGSLAPLLAGMTGDQPDHAMLTRIEAPATILLPEGVPMVVRTMGERLVSLLARARLEEIGLEPDARLAIDAGWSAVIARALIVDSN